jgi:lysophospholipase L1-like esterase
MDKPILNKVNIIEPLDEQGFDRYLPSSYNNAFSMIQKINLALNKLSEIGAVTNDTVSQWNTVMDWVMNDGLTEDVTNRINDFLTDGTLLDIINNTLFKDYDSRLKVAESKANNAASGTPKGSYDTLTLLQSAFPSGTTGIYVVKADGKWYYWSGTSWTAGGQYLANPVSDWSITTMSLAKQRAEIIDMSGAVYVDYSATSSVVFNATKTGQINFAMAGGIARQIVIPDPTQAYIVSPSTSVETYVVYYLVIDNTGTPSFKRFNLLNNDDFIVGITYNGRISLFYSQNNGRYDTGELLIDQYIKHYRQAKMVYIPKGIQVTKDQDSFYSTNHAFFKISNTETARFYAINRLTNEVVSMMWRDVQLLSKKFIVFGYSFRGSVYMYGRGFITEAYINKKGWTKDASKMIMESVKNPFVRTNTKLIGDSITSGTGGTGFSETGTLMFTDVDGTIHNENLTTATCWANMMRQLTATYSGNTYIEPLHVGFYWSTTPTLVVNTSTSQSAFSYRMSNVGDSIAFVFYGDHFDINFGTTAISGMVDVIVDGVVKQTFDLYSDTSLLNVIKSVTGLTKDYHSVVLQIATNRNALSTGNRFYFNGITVSKEIAFKNWGIAGINSNFVYRNLSKFIETTDDLYIVQLGTNDRKESTNWQIISMYQRNIVEALLNNGSDVIMMTANSGEIWNETSSSRYFQTNKVADENMKICNEYNLPYISNYNAFLYYQLMPNAVYTDLMDPDGTHPNDKGHKLMFRNICEKTGLNSFIGIG